MMMIQYSRGPCRLCLCLRVISGLAAVLRCVSPDGVNCRLLACPSLCNMSYRTVPTCLASRFAGLDLVRACRLVSDVMMHRDVSARRCSCVLPHRQFQTRQRADDFSGPVETTSSCMACVELERDNHVYVEYKDIHCRSARTRTDTEINKDTATA